MRYGVIYIAHNPRDGAQTFKVGMTERSVDERMKELTSATSNIGVYTAIAYFVVKDIDAAEKACHHRLSRYRIQANREFFEIPLPQLIRAVREVSSVFGASDECPEIDGSDTPPLIGVSESLKSARLDLKDAKDQRKAAQEQSEQRINDWFPDIRHQILLLKGELKNETSLKYVIPSKCVSLKNGQYHFGTFWVLAKMTEEGPPIHYSAIRGGIYGAVDISNAIPGSVEARKFDAKTDDNTEFLKWMEPDDGRVGRISLYAEINSNSELPSPRMTVEAVRFKYDDYKQKMNEYRRQRSFSEPSEAFEFLISVLIENLAVEQTDVRKQEGVLKKKHGDRVPKIIDRSQFNLDAFQ